MASTAGPTIAFYDIPNYDDYVLGSSVTPFQVTTLSQPGATASLNTISIQRGDVFTLFQSSCLDCEDRFLGKKILVRSIGSNNIFSAAGLDTVSVYSSELSGITFVHTAGDSVLSLGAAELTSSTYLTITSGEDAIVSIGSQDVRFESRAIIVDGQDVSPNTDVYTETIQITPEFLRDSGTSNTEPNSLSTTSSTSNEPNPGPPHDPTGHLISGGAIAGIVIGCLIAGALMGMAVLIVLQRWKAKSSTAGPDAAESGFRKAEDGAFLHQDLAQATPSDLEAHNHIVETQGYPSSLGRRKYEIVRQSPKP